MARGSLARPLYPMAEKSREGRSIASNNTRVPTFKLLCKGQGRTMGVVTVRAFSVSICYERFLRFGNRFLIALLEHRFEFFFERARRNSELAKRRQVV